MLNYTPLSPDYEKIHYLLTPAECLFTESTRSGFPVKSVRGSRKRIMKYHFCTVEVVGVQQTYPDGRK